MRLNTQAGFTLLELLVVISIVSLFSSIVLSSTAQARRKARDSVRKQTLLQLQKALESYYNDNNQYPHISRCQSSEAGDNPICDSAPGNYIPGLVPKYIAKLPGDPLGGTGCPDTGGGSWKRAFVYYIDDAGLASGIAKSYKLLSHCSWEAGFTPNDSFNDPARDGGPLVTTRAQANNPAFCDGPNDNANVWGWSVMSDSSVRCY